MSEARPSSRRAGRLSLRRALRLDRVDADPHGAGCCVAFAGAGGKTTAMFQLAREFRSTLAVTTTTHLGCWQARLADRHLQVHSPAELENAMKIGAGVLLVSGPEAGDRIGALDPASLERLDRLCRERRIPLLIEADGSRGRAVKAPGEHEPAIPRFADLVVVVAGLSALGRPLSDETAHRSERFAALSGLQPGDAISAPALARVLANPAGGLKGVPSTATRAALLNQADDDRTQAQGGLIATALREAYHATIIASLSPGTAEGPGRVHAVHEPLGAIVLAAGGASRYGEPKQMLDWHGEPFVRVIARTALEAGCQKVVVVTGAFSGRVQAALEGLPVAIAFNPGWQEGQAASVRAGLGALLAGPGMAPAAAFFLLADQPQVGRELLHAMRELHARSLAPVIAPLVEDRRCNPVLFDRQTFPDLAGLQGDTGGRAIFSRYSPAYLTWHDARLLLDVDRPSDYRRLLEAQP